MKTEPAPDWSQMPDLIPSLEVARLFHVLPKTLSKYANRGVIARPVETGTNHALYRKQDVVQFWQTRELRKAQGYIKAPDEPPTGGVTPADQPPIETALALPPDALQAVTEAVSEGVRRGSGEAVAELVAEVRALREELQSLRQEAKERESQPPTKPPTLWRKLFTKA